MHFLVSLAGKTVCYNLLQTVPKHGGAKKYLADTIFQNVFARYNVAERRFELLTLRV